MRSGRPRKIRQKKSIKRRRSRSLRGMKSPKQGGAVRARRRVRRRKGY